MSRFALAGILLLALLALAACDTASHFGAVETELAKDVGVLTYNQAVERWGPATRVSQGAGQFTAYWQKERAGGVVTERLWLTFDQRTKRLRAYRYTSKPFD